MVSESRVARSPVEHSRARDLISELVQQVMSGTVVVSENLAATLDARIAELDAMLSDQLSAVMHAPEFQKLESSWRGLEYLCKQSATGQMLKIKVSTSRSASSSRTFAVRSNLTRARCSRRSTKKSLAPSGGAPFGTLLGDFDITRQPEDMYFIEQMSHVAAAAHAPFISAASPELFGLEGFTDLGKPRDLSKVFDTVEYAKWKSFRESEDARYVGLTLPHFLGRLPYNPKDGTTVEGFNFVEDVDGTDHSKYLWVNAAYAFTSRITDAFDKYGWCAAIRGSKAVAWWKICLPTPSRRTRVKSR
nr:type VI secretion system contractile sheath large subunit [Niveibacterium microcysteis]